MAMKRQRPGCEAGPSELFSGGNGTDNSATRGGTQLKKPKLAFDAVVHDTEAGDRVVRVEGRTAWALRHLVEAGEVGCTPITTPGPRWSHYVWCLRQEGIRVETIHESHGGPFAGHHARYVLRSRVSLRDTAELREVAA